MAFFLNGKPDIAAGVYEIIEAIHCYLEIRPT